jgi:hypothetical protein
MEKNGLEWNRTGAVRGLTNGGCDRQRLAEQKPVAGEDGVETADVGHEPLHEVQQKGVDENTVENGGRLAEETRPRWCVCEVGGCDGYSPADIGPFWILGDQQ